MSGGPGFCSSCGTPWSRHGTACAQGRRGWTLTETVGVLRVTREITEAEAHRRLAAGAPQAYLIGGSSPFGPTNG